MIGAHRQDLCAPFRWGVEYESVECAAAESRSDRPVVDTTPVVHSFSCRYTLSKTTDVKELDNEFHCRSALPLDGYTLSPLDQECDSLLGSDSYNSAHEHWGAI